ncbi:MAG: TFIIB-type zinc ribbon-containing protein, partial [Ktedonobacterales bacterium]
MPLLTCPHCGSAVTTRDIETAPLRCPVCGAALTSAPAPEPAPAAAPAALPIQEAEVRDASYHSGWQDRAEDDSATHAVARDKLEPISAQARTDHSYDQRAQAADEATHALPFSPGTLGAPPADDPREATHALPLSAIPQEAQPMRRAPGLRAALLALAALALVVVIAVAALAGNGL